MLASPVAIPRVKNLQLNYRTHNGILACAAGIVDLLEKYFPNTIDILPRERCLRVRVFARGCVCLWGFVCVCACGCACKEAAV